MTRQAFTIVAIAFICGTGAAAPLVTYESPCECRDYHGKGRLTEKNDAALPPTDPNAIQAAPGAEDQKPTVQQNSFYRHMEAIGQGESLKTGKGSEQWNEHPVVTDYMPWPEELQ